MIKVENLYKSFLNKDVLVDINAEFNKGEVNLIIGKSGSGKTILLKTIVGLYNVNKGHVYYDDIDFHALKSRQKKLLRRKVGMLFQGSALFDSYSVLDNVKFPLNVFSKLTKKEKYLRVQFCLEHVGLSNVDDLLPSEISGGMKKRVAIARAIALNPEYLFCDEPNSGLDPQTAVVIDKLIQDLTYEFKMTTIVLTHDINSMLGIGDNIVFLHNGEVGWKGNKNNILENSFQPLHEFLYSSRILKHLSI